jgi:Tfp pilus assembly protein PilF
MDTGCDMIQAKNYVEEGITKLEEKSQLPFAHYLLADIYNRLGRPHDAMEQVRRAQSGT